jgi:hypothetical protein
MALPTTSGSSCHVPRPIEGMLAPVFRTKDSAIFDQDKPRETEKDYQRR